MLRRSRHDHRKYPSHPWGFVTGHTWTISNDKINNFRYGLTREAFTNQGDSTVNAITFRSVLSTQNFSRGFSRTTPVQNLTDDFSWVRGNHSLGFGTNVRIRATIVRALQRLTIMELQINRSMPVRVMSCPTRLMPGYLNSPDYQLVR